jgi:hypothetical protein
VMGGKAKPMVQSDRAEREGDGEIDGGGDGDRGKICFLSKAKETLMVNMTP